MPSQPRANRHGALESARCKLSVLFARIHERIKCQQNAPLVLARILADLQDSGPGRGFPVDMPGAVVELVVADGIEVVPAPALITFQFSTDQRQNFTEFRRRLDGRIHQGFDFQIDAACFWRKPNGTSCAIRALPAGKSPAGETSSRRFAAPSAGAERAGSTPAGQEYAALPRRELLSSFSFFLRYQQYGKRRHRLPSSLWSSAIAMMGRPAKMCSGSSSRTSTPLSTSRESRPEINTPASRHARIMREGYFPY